MSVADDFWDIWLRYQRQTAAMRKRSFFNSDMNAALCAVLAVAPVTENKGYFEIFDGPAPPKSCWRWLVSVRAGQPFLPRWSQLANDPHQRETLYGPEIHDVIACSQDLKQVTSSMIGCATVVGWPQHPYQARQPIRVRESPLAWLLARGDGVFFCGRDREVGDWLRECESGVVVSSVAMGEAMEKKMKRAGIARPRILIDA